MSRVQLALNVDDLEASIAFYSKLFNTTPAKVKPGYANFAITEPALKLVLLENRGEGGTINHLGVEVDSSETVHGEIARLAGEGLFTEEQINTTCCFATQDKVWVGAPDGERWEVYTVLADSDTSGEAPAAASVGSDLGCRSLRTGRRRAARRPPRAAEICIDPESGKGVTLWVAPFRVAPLYRPVSISMYVEIIGDRGLAGAVFAAGA